MNGLRRTEEGPEASHHLGQFSLAHRGVQLLEKGADVAGKTAGAAQSAYTSFTSDEDLSDSGDQAVRSASGRLNRAGSAATRPGAKGTTSKTAGPKPQGKGSGAAARTAKKPGRGAAPNVRGAGGAVKSQLRSRSVTSTARKSGKAAAKVGTTASRGALAASRAATAVANAVRVAVAAVTSALSTSPVAIVAAIVVGVVVLIISVIGWLIPGVQQEREHGGGNYPIGVPPGPWGGWANGFIPEELLSPIPWEPSHLLRSDAVGALVALNNDFRAEFGYDININDAYRDYAGQVEQREIWCSRNKCGNAAEPGTSNHGWALAADLGSGISSFGTPQYRWMKEHAPSYGWQHPAWAEPDGAHPEPWHWDFWGWAGAGGGDTTDAKEYARQALGGDTMQFQCLDRLWNGESNWNPLAENPSSGAYGIPQALPPEKLAEAGPDWRTNGVTQVKWGLTYIKDRYGTPCDAWAFWQSKDPHWY